MSPMGHVLNSSCHLEVLEGGDFITLHGASGQLGIDKVSEVGAP